MLRGAGRSLLLAALVGCGSDPPASAPGAGGVPPTSDAGSSGMPASAGSGAGIGAALGGVGGGSAGTTAGGGTAGEVGGGSAGEGGGSGGSTAGPVVDRSDPKLHEFELDPHELDPSTADSPALQYAQLDTRAQPLGRLVVFLPGANNVPRDWRDHGRQLASYGFHVLIPHYNNRWSTNGTCDGQGNTCNNDTRWEALVGEDTSTAIAIARADSAEGRVVTMLKHLLTAHAGGDWGFYLGPNDAVLYDKMLIAGISHGAASAGMYAIARPFTRAVLHSSGPAGNKNDPKMTPLSEWYAFTHTADPAYDAIASAIANFELPGDPAASIRRALRSASHIASSPPPTRAIRTVRPARTRARPREQTISTCSTQPGATCTALPPLRRGRLIDP